MRKLTLSCILAALLWFFMFSCWTVGLVNFWLMMNISAIILIILSYSFGREWKEDIRFSWKQVMLGIAIAAILWGLFWVGDKVSQMMFCFAREGVDSIYDMKGETNKWIIAVALLFVIGPAEELFWRGYVQRKLMMKMGKNWGFVVATLIYTLIHIWSFNFMLVMAALVCGMIWGGLYRLRPKWFLALIISHAVWDACAFVVFPF